MAFVIALAGNPNCGKTTLFNRLTGSRQHAANWPGVTVDVHTGTLHARYQQRALVADLPGTYSLHPQSGEESIARRFLMQSRPSVLIHVADATALERSLRLTRQLMALGIPMALALNMMDEARKQGVAIELSTLEKRLGMPVVPICARTGEGLSLLLQRAAQAPVPPFPRFDPSQLAASCCRWPEHPHASVTERIDRILMHPLGSLPLFATMLLAIFFVAFGPVGAWLTDAFSAWMDRCAHWLFAHLPNWASQTMFGSLLKDGVWQGVGSVLRFLPSLMLLFFLLSLLEDSGYLSRAAFLMDRPLRSLGLSGRSLIPLMLGFGCTVPAVLNARTLSTRNDRILTILLLPFISCGAKLPVYTLFAQAFFPGHTLAVVCALYLAGILLSLPASWCFRRLLRQSAPASLMLELPPYRLPTLLSALRLMAGKAGDFLSRAFGLVLWSTIIVWFLQRFTPRFVPAQRFDQSLLGILSSAFAPLLAPAGFGTPQAAAALFSGLLAKENIVSTLAILCPGSLQALFPSAGSAVSFLLFVLLYAPCAAALVIIRREIGSRWMLACAAWQTAFAWLVSTLAFQLGRLL